MSEWRDVTKLNPCSVCGKPDWCGVSQDGSAACCMRVQSDKRAGNGGHIHKLGSSIATLPPKSRSAPKPTPNFEKLSREYQAAVAADALKEHARALGVSTESLSRLGVGWDGHALTFPMQNAAGMVLGIRRRFDDGRKLSVKGGHEGLFIPSGLADHGTLYVCEGPTDTAALLTLGLQAIGRPSCRGAIELTREVCKGRNVVIVTDADKPGREGAHALAEVLVSACESVRIISPPDGVKDARAWLASGATKLDIEKAALKAEPVTRESTPGTGDDWTEPLAFAVYDVPALPLEAIPEQLAVLRTFCEAASESFQVPVDAVTLLALSVGGAAFAKRIEVEVKADWREPVNLFIVVAMPSGERKSALFRAVTAPVADFERDENERLAPLIEKNRNERAILEASIKRARNDAVTAKKSDARVAARALVDELAEELRTTEVLVPIQLVAEDATPEAVSQLLAEQGGRIALLAPEADVFDLMAGRYSDGVSRLGVYLKGHAGDDIRVNRIGRASEYVQHPALTVGLAVQPDVLQGLLDRPQLRGRGLLARFLYSLPNSRVGYRELEPEPIPKPVATAYAQLIRAALRLKPATDSKGEPCPHVVRVSTEARAELNRFRESVERGLRRGGELAGLRDWGSKLPGAVCRIAGVFHGLMHIQLGNPASESINGETMLGAIALGEYFIEHAKAAFGLMGSDKATALARRILDWLTDTGLTEFTKRDAHRATRVERVDELNDPLRLLVEHGHVRRKLTDRTGPGRMPSTRYEVNPLWLGQSGQKGQNSDAGGIVSVLSPLSGGIES